MIREPYKLRSALGNLRVTLDALGQIRSDDCMTSDETWTETIDRLEGVYCTLSDEARKAQEEGSVTYRGERSMVHPGDPKTCTTCGNPITGEIAWRLVIHLAKAPKARDYEEYLPYCKACGDAAAKLPPASVATIV